MTDVATTGTSTDDGTIRPFQIDVPQGGWHDAVVSIPRRTMLVARESDDMSRVYILSVKGNIGTQAAPAQAAARSRVEECDDVDR